MAVAACVPARRPSHAAPTGDGERTGAAVVMTGCRAPSNRPTLRPGPSADDRPRLTVRVRVRLEATAGWHSRNVMQRFAGFLCVALVHHQHRPPPEFYAWGLVDNFPRMSQQGPNQDTGISDIRKTNDLQPTLCATLELQHSIKCLSALTC